jgi:hypothetical protein
LLQHVADHSKEVRYIFCCDTLSELEGDKSFTVKMVCGDQGTFRKSWHITRHNVTTYGSMESSKDKKVLKVKYKGVE